MKKNLLFIKLLIFTGWLNAQVYLTENFESAFTGTPAAPPGWTQSRLVLIGDGNPEPTTTNGEKDWQQNVFQGMGWSINPGVTTPSSAVSGTAVLFMNDYYFGGTSNAFGSRRMESPSVNLASSTNPYVRFWLFAGDASNKVFFRVVGSNDGGNTWRTISFVIPNANVTSFSSATPWQRINVNIPSDFKVSNAKFGIEYTNTWGVQGIFIDDFSIEEFTPTTITSAGSGGWNNPATWVGGVVPTSDHHVVIAAGHTVQVDCNTARCQNIVVDGVLTYSSTSTTQLLHIMGDATVSATGTIFSGNGTTGKRMYFGGNLVNNGTLNFQPGTSITGALYWIGYQHNFTNSGTIFNNRVPVVVHAAGSGVNYLNTFTISNTCALYMGTVTANPLTLGNPPASAINVLERHIGSFVGSPAFNNTNVTSRNVSFITPINTNGVALAVPQQVIIPGTEIELISGNRHITGTFSMTTHNNVQLNYPLIVGTATSGGITLTRGIVQTSSVNLLTLNTNVAGVTGTAPSTVTSIGTNGGTHGSYVDGPVRINFPATGTTNRIFPVGKGFAFHTNLPSTNIRRPVTIVSNGVAWNSQTITASIENAPSGTANAPLTMVMGNLAYRLNYNGGPSLSPNAAITFSFENSTFASFDNLLGDLADIRIAQAPALTGPWTERSSTSGSGPISNNTLYGRTTATAAPGPITTDEYFAWSTVGSVCSGTPNPGSITGTNNVCFGSSTTLSLTGASSGVGISYQWAASTSSAGPFTTTLGNLLTQNTGTMGTTMYYVVTTSCSTSGSTATTPVFTLNVNPLANITVTATSNNYCGGPNGPTLTASGAANYTWSPAASLSSSTGVNVVATPTSNTTYTIVGTTSAGCSGPQASVAISVVPNVSVVSLSSSSTLVCSGSSVALSSTVTNSPLSYCTPSMTSGSGSGDYINSFTLNTLNNSASGPIPTPFYTLYPQSLHTTTLVAGNTYTLSVQSGSYSGTFNFGIFIDFNQNGNLSDAGEKIAQLNGTGAFSVMTTTFVVPTGATNGDTRLRVREWFANNNIDPCNTGGFGETEDYIVTITGGVNPTNTYTWSPAANLSSPNSATTNANNITASTIYTLNVNNQFGCPGQGTVLVSVNPGPTITANSASVCAGATAVITASGATSYTWSNGPTTNSISVSPSVTTVYTVTGTDGTCTANQTATVTVNALPGVSLTAAQNTACVNGATIQLTGSPSGGVYTGSNVTGSSFNPASTGTFTPVYTYTDSNGCSNSATTTIVVSTCAGLYEFAAAGSIAVMPNPNNGLFVVKSSNAFAEQIQVMDLTGKIIYTGRFNADGEINVDMTGFSKGMYMLKVISKNNKEETFRIIRQ